MFPERLQVPIREFNVSTLELNVSTLEFSLRMFEFNVSTLLERLFMADIN